MIKKTYKIMLGLSFLLIGGLTITDAQIPSDSILKADIPFSFSLRDKTFPAGEYTIKQSEAIDDSDFVLEILSDTNRSKTMIFETFATSENQAPKNSNLVFDKIGDKYFLSKIFIVGDSQGNEIEKSKMEKNLEKGNVTKEKYIVKTGRWKVIEKIEKEVKGKN